MNEFYRGNIAGIIWLKKPIENIEIKLHLKPKDGIISLPKFEGYSNEANGLCLEKLESKTEEYVFKWQEKVFSLWELQRYSDVHNCLTENELNYYEMIKNEDYTPSKIFSYVHEDFHLPLPSELKNLNSKESASELNNLNTCFQMFGFNENLSRMVCMLGDTSSTGNLFRSTENIVSGTDKWTAMHVAFDYSEYNEDSQLLLKQETILLSLYHNRTHNYLIISPDVNNLELSPYTLLSEIGVSLDYIYSVDIGFEETTGGEELVTLLRKLHIKWERLHKHIVNFEMPPMGKKNTYVSLELLTADNFEMDNLYVEFDIKIPEEIKCANALHGRTHVAKSIRIEDADHWNFGHLVDLNLEMDAGIEPQPIQLFFEVISTDWWGRHRTEGYCYLPLTLTPGRYSKQLSCSRPEEMNSNEAESRRFFVGGCHLIRDLEVLAKPQLIDANYKYTTSGNVCVRWNVISQAPLPGAVPKRDTYQSHGSGSASAILLGAEAVLRQYRKARARLAAATEGLPKVSQD